jgi:L-iditol 2-dehydrogenase
LKALVFRGIANSRIEEVDEPAITGSEIIIKVKACSICGTDIKLNKGASTKLTKHGTKNMIFPKITGHEIAGIITDIGGKVKDFNLGDRVNISPVIPCGECDYCRIGHQEVCDNKITIGFDIDGGFAEYLKIPEIAIREGCIHKIADDISFEEAAITEPLSVVLNSQDRSRVGPADSVLIIGAGPIGLLQIQVARYRGSSKIMVADISQDRLDFASKFGPDILINNKNDNLIEAVLESTDGNGADVVMICAPSKNLFSECLKLTNKLGRINYFAGLSKDDPEVDINANLIHYNELTVTGTSDSTPLQNKESIELINNRKIDIKNLISHRFSIEDYFKGLEIAQSGKAKKVVITF